MFRQIAISTAIAAVCAAPALADSKFEVAFDVPAGASALQVYAEFKETARLACAADLRRGGRTGLKVAMEQSRACNAELLGKAIAAVGDAQLAALHRSEMNDVQDQLLAQADETTTP